MTYKKLYILNVYNLMNAYNLMRLVSEKLIAVWNLKQTLCTLLH